MLKNIIPVLPIDIQNDNTSLSPKQHILLQQRYYSLAQLDQANNSLDNKAIMLLQSASLIFALIGALQFPKVIYNPTGWVMLVIGIAFLAFLGMVWLLVVAWSPKDYPLSGTNDWSKIHEEYLQVSNDESFTQVLDDCVETYDRLKVINNDKATKITWAVWLFVLQIIGLLLVAILPSILSQFSVKI